MKYCDGCGEPLRHYGGHGYWRCENPACDDDIHKFNRKGELIEIKKAVILGENYGKQQIG